jgi:hypothetical protein
MIKQFDRPAQGQSTYQQALKEGLMADFVMTLDDFIAELEQIRGQLDGTVAVLNAEDALPVRPVAVPSGERNQPTVYIEVIHA